MIRDKANPILTRADIPTLDGHIRDVSSVFNPGATKLGDETILLLRVQTRGRETVLVTAHSSYGVNFSVSANTLQLEGVESLGEKVYHIYDPRLTWLDGVCYIMVAMDTDNGCRLGLARTTDFTHAEFLGVVSESGVRNGVLFTEKVGGRYLRLDRPNRVQLEGGPSTGDAIRLCASDDLLHWEPVGEVFAGRPHYWDELIGAGPPPVKTRDGWLLLYHGVATHFAGVNIYQAGAALLDLADPTKVLARTRENILEPRELYELTGQVPNVVFPSGWVVDDLDDEGYARPDSTVRVYYGAADTCVGLAHASVRELVNACEK